ncbi:MAG: CBS domain-containing protein [Deltaproteobacteria bacterium]|nr:CBS domain-containing protein [Deltaproteobacteria bacterium]
MAQSYIVIEIYTGEGAKCDGKYLSEAVLDYIRKLKAPARCLVFKGIAGCTENGEVSTQRIMDLSTNQPIKIEIILPAAEADGVMANLQEMVSDGILGTRPLTVSSHRTQKRLFPPQTRVRDVMTSKPVSVKTGAPADRVMTTLLSANFTGVPVVDPENRPVGVVSQSDLIYRAGMPVRLALMAQSDPVRLKTVLDGLSEKISQDIMTSPAITVQETDLLTHAVDTMLQKQVKRLLVVDASGFLTGMLSRMDIFRTITREAPDWERMQNHHVHIENSQYVSDIMRRNTLAVAPDTPVHEVLTIIDNDDIQRVAVVDPDGRLLGLISDRNLLIAFSDQAPGMWEVLSRLVPFSAKSKHTGKVRAKLGNQTAQAVMKTDLITINEKAEIDSAISLMTEHVIKRLPVVDDQGIFKGMISREVLLKEGFSAMKGFIGNG